MSGELSKLPPQAIEVEQAVLAALMLEKDAIHQVVDILKPEYFYKDGHSKIYQTILNLSDKSPVDLLTVSEQLRADNHLEYVGGVAYISEITTKVASSAHIQYHARIIADKHVKREMIRISAKIIDMSYNESYDVDETINYALTNYESINNVFSADGKQTNVVFEETIEQLQEKCIKVEKGETPGIPTGFVSLDNAIGGWKAPNYTILGARPSVGKTTEALHFAIKAAKAGYWVNLYTYEMLSSDLCEIALAGHCEVNRTNIRDGKLSDDEWNKINTYSRDFNNLPIIWYDNPNIRADQIKANSYKNNKSGKCDLVIIDYVQLIPADNPKDIREQQISKISRTLKRITTGYKIPVIALSQLNRDIEKRGNPEPQLSDLRESGTMEQDADIVMFMYAIEEGDEVTERWNKIAKNRRGKKGQFQIFDDGQMTKLTDLENKPF